jgi:hypothetical protein
VSKPPISEHPWSDVNRTTRNAFFSGMVLTVCIVQIPQRFTIVNNLSTIEAGIRLLPFAAVMTSTSMIMAIVLSKSKVPVLYWLLFGGLLQVAGTAGFSQSSIEADIHASQYGFQVLAGFGVGIFNVGLLLLTPHIVDTKFLGTWKIAASLTTIATLISVQAVANGAVNQFRVIGGSVGLSIVISASSSSLRNDLLLILEPVQVAALLSRTESIGELSLPLQRDARKMFGESYNIQMIILMGIAAANIPATLLQWQQKAVRLND